jgi:hypothetical protein
MVDIFQLTKYDNLVVIQAHVRWLTYSSARSMIISYLFKLMCDGWHLAVHESRGEQHDGARAEVDVRIAFRREVQLIKRGLDPQEGRLIYSQYFNLEP